MPFSSHVCRKEIVDYLCNQFSPEATVLDVGAGAGAYFDSLHHHFHNMDAVEAHAPYITRFGLESKYRKVFNTDIVLFDIPDYDIIIFGDVLEHLTVEQARHVLDAACRHAKEVLVIVPYACPQDAVDGVEYEVHRQPDLTRDVFLERYPQMELFCEHPSGSTTIAVFRKTSETWL
jgi:hypothetical protein